MPKAKELDAHPFDELKVTTSLSFLEQFNEWEKNDSLKSALYYLNFFQYRSGDLYRAILGREVIWDREFEETLMQTLDEVLSLESHSCRVYKYAGNKEMAIRGIFWRWNTWKKETNHCSMILRPGSKELIYVRRMGEQVDIEGPVLLRGAPCRLGVMTVSWMTWKDRYERLFKEVRLEGSDERSTYKAASSPWRVVDVFSEEMS